MSKNEKRINRRRLRSSYITSIISISLVLFLIGIVGLLVINGRSINKTVRENIGFNVILKENVKDADIFQLQKILDAKVYSLSTEYITKEQAALETEQLVGGDFVEFLGFNPLPPSIKLRLQAAYTKPDSVMFIEEEILKYDQVNEVVYKKTLLYAINENIRKISLVILGFSILLLLVATTLINNTIRLSIYSKRFIINSMQLVGATRSFVRKPFLLKSILNGFIGALIALALIAGLIYITSEELENVIRFSDVNQLTLLGASILIISIVINWISTFFAVNKYLNIKTDKLYF
ncbi:MAG: permease-like cell division protein FtsX [Bacteroidales bacterium]|jgi:cell division transport system permease protein|nr:permease-like cell division protein FtsX [Bacteroidales bacterium]